MGATSLLSWIPSIAYPPAQEGRWSPVTSTLNWCEEDYYATIYAAEIVNTLTNLWFMYLSAKGIRNCIKNDHASVYLVGYIGYLLVGTGSFLFHSTLKYPMQLVDELSMIYTTCLMCYATFSYNRSTRTRILLSTSLTSLSLFITWYYHVLQDPAFHQTVYALLTAIVFFRALYIMETTLRPRFRSSDRPPLRANEAHRDQAILRQMWIMIAWGLSSFLGGFGLWYLDIRYCGVLRRWRRNVGMPWGFLLELHGWWHLMTGLGGYAYLVWGIWLRCCLDGRLDEVDLEWGTWWSMPVVVRKKRVYKGVNGKANGGANGGVNGKVNGKVNGSANGHANGSASKKEL